MEEELNYATVVFKNGSPPSNETKEEQTVYAVVKPRVPATTAAQDGETAARSHSSLLLAVCFGIFCVLLVASLSGLICFKVMMNQQRGELYDLIAEKEKLFAERNMFEKEVKQLSRVTENLAWTLNAILKFDNFPVKDYCPEKTECQPCKNGWILFQGKCYLFYEMKTWLTWQGSRSHCQNEASDLVVIESQQKQEFISNHTKFYYDQYHGYWMGLYETSDKRWIWVDGRNATLGYWIKGQDGTSSPFGLMIPDRNLTDSWDQVEGTMLNKFICERESLIRSD